ncbi:RDD family protein [Verrucomicrobiales bacterium]|nr:RDD family protein [Verrucomicrobiales bacterium]MDB4808482.1 RDD family protein [Verrucomicrobiales bacterium]
MSDSSPPPPINEDARKTLLGKRFTAALIDGFICLVIVAAFGIIHQRIGALAGALYILAKDGLNLPFMKGRSFGKHVLKIQPVSLSGGSMDLSTSASRNITLALPSIAFVISGGFIYFILSIICFAVVAGELFLVVTRFNGQRFGDQLANTEVR